MSILRADSIRNREGTGAPNLPNGMQLDLPELQALLFRTQQFKVI